MVVRLAPKNASRVLGDVPGDGYIAEFSQCAEQPAACLRSVSGYQQTQVKGPHAVETGGRPG